MVQDPEELLTISEFLKELRVKYNIELERGTLQFYSSPKWRLLPPPTFKGRHVSHYPRKYLDLIRVILLLRTNHWKLSEIKKLFKILPEESIGRIVNETMPVSRVDWLFSSITKTDSSESDLVESFVNLVKLFLIDAIGKTLNNLYDKGSLPGNDPHEIILKVRTEIQEKRKEFLRKHDIIRNMINDQGFEDQIGELLKEFRAKLESPEDNISGWIVERVQKLLVLFAFALKA